MPRRKREYDSRMTAEALQSNCTVCSDRISMLESQLDDSRRAIVRLMSHDVQNILLSFYRCRSESQWSSWVSETAQRIVELAEAKPPNEMGEFLSASPRALCPLCRDSTQSPYGGSGFAVPDGLMRHLVGSHTSRQCDVLAAACALATSHRHIHEQKRA